MVEALTAFRELARERALEDLRHRQLVWALLAPHQKKPSDPPAIPPVLKESLNGG